MNFYKPRPIEPLIRGHKKGRYVTTAQGFLEWDDGNQIDLHNMLTGHKSSIYVMPIVTNIMRNSGLHSGGFMLVDTAKKPKRKDVLVVRYNDVVVVRRLEKSLTMWALIADDPREEKLLLHPHAEFQLIGVVIYGIMPI